MHWDPEFSDVKMIQSFLLTTELDRITRQHSTNPQKMPGELSKFQLECDNGVFSDNVR